MRAPEVVQDESFKTDLAALRETFPEIEDVVAELAEVLQLGYQLPEIPVDENSAPQVYAQLLDYPPKGVSGLQQFLVTYHATDPEPSPRTPLRTFTLLTIADRRHR